MDAGLALEVAVGVLALDVDRSPSWMPAAPPSSRSVIWVVKRFDSAHIRYIRRSISAQSQASVPPAPAWIVTKALQWSFGPPSIERSSNASKSARRLLVRPGGSRRRTRRRPPPRPARSRPRGRRPARPSSSNGLSTALSVFSSWMIALAFSWSFQNVGPFISGVELVAAGLLVAQVKESLGGGRSARSRSWPSASARCPRPDTPEDKRQANGVSSWKGPAPARFAANSSN